MWLVSEVDAVELDRRDLRLLTEDGDRDPVADSAGLARGGEVDRLQEVLDLLLGHLDDDGQGNLDSRFGCGRVRNGSRSGVHASMVARVVDESSHFVRLWITLYDCG